MRRSPASNRIPDQTYAIAGCDFTHDIYDAIYRLAGTLFGPDAPGELGYIHDDPALAQINDLWQAQNSVHTLAHPDIEPHNVTVLYAPTYLGGVPNGLGSSALAADERFIASIREMPADDQ